MALYSSVITDFYFVFKCGSVIGLGRRLFLRGTAGKSKPNVYYMKKSNYGKEV